MAKASDSQSKTRQDDPERVCENCGGNLKEMADAAVTLGVCVRCLARREDKLGLLASAAIRMGAAFRRGHRSAMIAAVAEFVNALDALEVGVHDGRNPD